MKMDKRHHLSAVLGIACIALLWLVSTHPLRQAGASSSTAPPESSVSISEVFPRPIVQYGYGDETVSIERVVHFGTTHIFFAPAPDTLMATEKERLIIHSS